MTRSAPRFGSLFPAALALATAGALTLGGCSPSTKEAATQTGQQMGEAAKDAATATGEAAKDAASATGEAAKKAATTVDKAALAPALNPVLDLLRKGEGEVKAGNLATAIATMGGFKALWATAGPVIQPLAGDKWPVIDTAAKLVLSTFDKGASPDAATAGSAITGLIGPLSALLK